MTANDPSLLTQEGPNIIKIAATSGSKRAELGNHNFNTRMQEDKTFMYLKRSISRVANGLKLKAKRTGFQMLISKLFQIVTLLFSGLNL